MALQFSEQHAKIPRKSDYTKATLYRHTRGVGVHSFLTFALHENAWLASAAAALTPGERSPSTHHTVACQGPKVGLNILEKKQISSLRHYTITTHNKTTMIINFLQQ